MKVIVMKQSNFNYSQVLVPLTMLLALVLLTACPVEPGCPSGKVENDEECDDGNYDSGDGCSEYCELEECGNNRMDIYEECDDGNEVDTDLCRNDCTIRCATDDDCGDGEICVDEECVEGCRNDSECTTSGEICLANECAKGCREDSDCAVDEACDAAACVPTCDADSDCAADEVCDADKETCVKGCRNDAACVQATGNTDSICRRPFAASGLTLTGASCDCASDCNGKEVCAAGGCASAGSRTAYGSCVKGCRTAAQCPAGQVCNASGICHAPCATDADCCAIDRGNSGDTCVGGACLDSCASDDDCDVGSICNGTACVAGCRENDDCDTGQICDGSNSCVGPLCGVDSKCVFVTSADVLPDFQGAAGADARCQDAAENGSPTVSSLTFQAWVSDDISSPLDRFARSSVPYKLLDGTTVATNWADLVDGTLNAPIDRDEFNGPRQTAVWTNTRTVGDADNSNANTDSDSCENWTSIVATSGRVGDSAASNFQWTENETGTCAATPAGLYCFQQ